MLPLRALFIGISLNIYKPQVKAKRPRLEHIKYKKISMKMKYLSKKNLIVVLSHLFLSIKHIFQKSGKTSRRHVYRFQVGIFDCLGRNCQV